MSTRATVIIIDQSETFYFYRHSDGYPKVTGESLKEFVKIYQNGARPNASQSAGWLIVHGFKEYLDSKIEITSDFMVHSHIKNSGGSRTGWKVGAYEPATDVSGDSEYVYTIDLVNMILTCEGEEKMEPVKIGGSNE